MIKPNIGLLDAMIRIACGLSILAWTTAKMVRRPWRQSYYLLAIVAASKVAEGITRFCPMTALFEQYKDRQQRMGDFEVEDDIMNPS